MSPLAETAKWRSAGDGLPALTRQPRKEPNMPLRINEGDELQRHILLQREVREEVLAEMETQQRSQGPRQLTIRETFERAFPDYVSIDHGDPAGDRPSVLT